MWRSKFCMVVLACLSWFLADVSRAQERRAIERPRSLGSEMKIREALDEITTFEFIETPLADAIEYLKDAHEIPIRIDVKALSEAGVTRDAPITCNIKGITLRSALRSRTHRGASRSLGPTCSRGD